MKTLKEAAAYAGMSTNGVYYAAKKLQTQDYEFAAVYHYYDMCAVSVRGNHHEWVIRAAENRLGRKMLTQEELEK